MHAIKHNDAARLVFSHGTLLFDGVSRETIRTHFAGIPWQWDERVGQWRCDAIWYSEIIGLLDDSSTQVENLVPQQPSVHWPYVAIHPLREEQRKALAAWMPIGKGVVVMPTGTGKTEVALTIMQQTAVSTLVVCPVRDLMYQWHHRILEGLGYDAGIIGDNTFNVRPVSVTTYDSACIHMGKLGAQFKLLIFDECHHLPGPMRRDAALMSIAPMRLGLTATPERSDNRHLDLQGLIGPIVYALPMAEVKGRTLADYEVVRIPVHLSPEEQTTYDRLAGEVRNYMHLKVRETPGYSWQDLCAEAGKDPECRKTQKAFHAKTAIEDRAEEKLRVLEDLFRLHADDRVLVFTGSNAMAREVSKRFLVPCLLNHCRKKERGDILDGFKKAEYKVIAANQVLDEGVDIPEAKIAIVVGGQTSVKQAKQRLGRILRKQADAKATLYEVVCAETREEQRSRQRRRSDAYAGTRHRRI
ncbi:MAG: DEAD/DEAH box helicase family protein [Verrucomicrobia bacterium]|nr:DEAD/DEAH box helicase family protein [Verrucomicrobiota bacterium]MBU4291701.1 DEAD/DEAH box helicase family protein [Verrucomicrobiota bacterium]MBU4427945.1 DEAD/DEAH box helicase family protein [Verrucomicrobiota bacterium]MBU4498239.1 DEAD/DEAH box helicase family protein [Verrucomicrobiota bacterium]MCG2678731.1 DEAD/DEAH box helicase family protein [Kiritimatiellia bacterium]